MPPIPSGKLMPLYPFTCGDLVQDKSPPMTSDHSLIDELGRLERAGDLAAGLRLLAQRALPPEGLMVVATLLYRNGLSALPFVIAEQLLQAGEENWVLRA